MKIFLTAVIAFCLPTVLARIILNLLGHEINASSRIGFSLLFCKKIILKDGAAIGHFNFLRIDTLMMEAHASIGSKNRMRGPFDVIIGNNGHISTSNGISRAKFPVTYGKAVLKLGTYAIITHDHKIDLTCSVSLGDYSIIAGSDSQLWTHGYYHADAGLERVRVDGDISIGHNVYVGSRCVFNPGVTVGDAIHIGANCCIAKSLLTPGMYVSQPLRYVENNIEMVKGKLHPVSVNGLADVVYSKNKSSE